ncbi:MAG: hypothetical protein FGF51_05880, partial [Candidatus Brockarchaeota archaeon]|nr:hypothetical protein [Candidatus Brockarchaeota archaeon]
LKPLETHENEERSEISYCNRAIVSALKKMGVPVGEKIRQDYHVPEVIREGDENIKRAYLYQTMMDEGTWAYRGFRYTQAAVLNLDELSEDDRKYLDEHLRKEKTYPRGDAFHYVYLSKDLSDEIQKKHSKVWEVIEKSKPSFLEEELDMLEEICGLKLELKPRDIYTTTKGEYRVSWCIETSKKEEYNTILERLGLPKDKHIMKDEKNAVSR